MIPESIRSYVAAANVAGKRLVKFTAARTVNIAVDAAAPVIGVSERTGGDAGKMLDVITGGDAIVVAGAVIAAGAPVTADAQGRAVTAAPAAGVNAWIAGFAVDAATAAGDEIAITLSRSRIQG
jgi:hypothetical protein